MKKFEQYEKNAELKTVWKLLGKDRSAYFAAILFQGLSLLFRSTLYMLLAWFVDNWLLENEHTISIWSVTALFAICTFCQCASTFLSGKLLHYSTGNLFRRIRNRFFDHIQRLSFSWHDKADTGDLIVRATSDCEAITKLYSEQIYDISRIIVSIVINYSYMMQINTRLALINLIVFPLIVFTAVFFFSKISDIFEEFQKQDSIVSTVLQENLTGVRVVKAFARQDYEIEKFNREAEKRFAIGKKELLIESFFWPASDVFCWGQLGVSLYFGTKAAINGEISIGSFLAYQSLITMVIWPLRNLGRQIVYISRAKICRDRLLQVLDAPQEDLKSGSQHLGTLSKGIKFENVSFAYERQEVLKNISFMAPVGSVTAIIGSTGCGKTSLINLMARFYPYSSGSIQYDETELNSLSIESVRNMIGMVEQEPFLFSSSIADNIAYGVDRKVTLDEIISAAKAADIHESIIRFENGYNTLVGERGVTLSGGQKQRIAIARAFLKAPKILILDDSLSAVDTVTENHIQQSLRTLMKGRTTFIVAHRTDSIQDADQILVMDHGQIIQRGTHQELIAQEGMYRNIFQIQTRIETELEEELSHE